MKIFNPLVEDEFKKYSKRLAYYFEIIRRRLIGVDTAHIMKDIRQT